MFKPASFSLFIPAKTIVGRLRNSVHLGGERRSDTVELQGPCFVDGAVRQDDGSYAYTLPGAGAVYFVAGGCCTATATAA